jgi:rhodanese-related sulfurtransferase
MFVRGTGRADFQNGDPERLYTSLTEVLFALPDHTRVWPGHDYRGHTTSTVGEEKRFNPRVAGKSREQFVEVMNNLALPRPKKLDVAVPANRACGQPGRDIDPHEAYAQRDETRVVDVREHHEYNGDLGHIPSAQLIPLSHWPAAIVGWDPDGPVTVVCRSGGRSARAAKMLVDRGFTRVTNMRGGMLAYTLRSLPVEGAQSTR